MAISVPYRRFTRRVSGECLHFSTGDLAGSGTLARVSEESGLAIVIVQHFSMGVGAPGGGADNGQPRPSGVPRG